MKLRKCENAENKIKDNINKIKKWKDGIKDDRANASFSRAIQIYAKAIANVKALKRTAKKIQLLSPDDKAYKNKTKEVLLYFHRLKELVQEYNIDLMLKEAIEKAEAQQQERVIIEECLSKHKNLDKYQGDDRGPREENNI